MRNGRQRQYQQRRVDLEGYCVYLHRRGGFRKQLLYLQSRNVWRPEDGASCK